MPVAKTIGNVMEGLEPFANDVSENGVPISELGTVPGVKPMTKAVREAMEMGGARTKEESQENPPKKEPKAEEKETDTESESEPKSESEVEIEGVKYKAEDVKAALEKQAEAKKYEDLEARLATDAAFRSHMKAKLAETENPPPETEKEPEIPKEIREAFAEQPEVLKFFVDQSKALFESRKVVGALTANLYAMQFKENVRELAGIHGCPMPTQEEAKLIHNGVMMGVPMDQAFQSAMKPKIEKSKTDKERERKSRAESEAGEEGLGAPPQHWKPEMPKISREQRIAMERETGISVREVYEDKARREASRKNL